MLRLDGMDAKLVRGAPERGEENASVPDATSRLNEREP
jgi:hypothetical protein